MTEQRAKRDGTGGAMPPRLARTGARRSGIAGALFAVILVAGASLFGTAPGAVADVAPTALPTVQVATVATGAPPTLAPTLAPTPAATQGAIQAPTSMGTPAVATVPTGTASATPSASPAVPASTGTPTATIAAVASPTAKAAIVNAGVTARAHLMANAYTSYPSVDLHLVAAPSLALGPGQVVAVDLQAWAGDTQIVGIDAFLDFDATRVQVDGIDLAGSPLDVVLQRTWVNEVGHVNLSLGRLVGSSGAGASGYFRVARITFRAAPGFTATGSAMTAPVTFAADRNANRETAILTRTNSVLRQAIGATIALNPAAIAVTAPPTADVSIIAGIPASVGFTILDAANRPAAGVAYAVEVRGDLSLVGPAAGTTDANGATIAQVKGATPGATGLVALKVGGTLAQARVVQVTTPVTVAVTIASPTFALARGTIPVVASPTFGPVPVGSRFEVEWRYRVAAGAAPLPVEPVAIVPVVGGIATATWDTSALTLAPAGVTRTEVILEAEARAVDGTGNVVGLATSTFGPMRIDNQAPALGAVAVAGQPMADDSGIRTRIATRTFAVTGVTEDASTVAVYRRDSISGPRPADATPLATAVAAQVGALRAAMSARAIVAPATASFMVELPAFTEADEVASGFYIDVEATDPAGNVGPVTLATVYGRPVVTPNPYLGWLTLDTVAPRVVRLATPTFNVGDANAGSRPVEITFSEPVALRPADYGTRIRLEQEILDIPEPIAGTLQVDCADDVRPTGTVAVLPSADGSCASGVKVARVIPAVPWYPGGTYHVTVASVDDASIDGQVPPAVADLAGNKLVTSVPGGVPTTHVAFIAPGAPAFPTAQISGILATASFAYVIHGTAANPVPLRATTANVDTDLDWRLCTSVDCAAATPTFIAVASPTYEVNWNTESTVGDTRTFPDVRNAYVVVHGRNRQISGALGHITDFRDVTLRSVGPLLGATDVNVRGKAGTRPAADGTFNIADDEDTTVAGLQAAFVGTILDAVPGTVTVSQGTRVVAVATNIDSGEAPASAPWTTSVGTVNDGSDLGRSVSLSVVARDSAVPVANVTSFELSASVDTVAPGVTLSYPPNRTRIAAPTGSAELPLVGKATEAATVTFRFEKDGQSYSVGANGPSSIDFPTGTDGKFAYPPTGVATPTFLPGRYALMATVTDRLGNPGATATSTFQVTPPPPPASLEPVGTVGYPGLIGPAIDEDPTTPGVQVTLRGSLQGTPTADAVPEGLVAVLRRNGVDATGEGGRAVIAPVALDSGDGTYRFVFPPQTFAKSATATFGVVTRDTAGSRSAESASVPVRVDVTAPAAFIVAPRPGTMVASTTPEVAVSVAALADGTYDVATATFEVRTAGSGTFRLVHTTQAPTGTFRLRATDWTNNGGDALPDPGNGNSQAYDLRVTLLDFAGNTTALASTFVLQPGVPSVTLAIAGTEVLGTIDLSQEDAPEFAVTATPTGEGVSITTVTATLKDRATGRVTPLTVSGTADVRTITLPNAALPNGSVFDLDVVATDSNGAKASTGATVRVVRPRSLRVKVTTGATPISGAAVSARRDAGDLPAITASSGPNDQRTGADGTVLFTGIPGGDVVIAIDGVPGYPTTTVIATVSEPHVTAAAPWEFTLDLDRLNGNTVNARLRGLPSSVTNAVSTKVGLEVSPAAGARYQAGTTPDHVRQSFGDDVARVTRLAPFPLISLDGTVVVARVRVPLGAVAWTVAPRLLGDAATAATIKGVASSDAAFTATPVGEAFDTSFRYVDANLRVKTLTGTMRFPDGLGVAGAALVVSTPGGLKVAVSTDLDGNFGPLFLEAGEYVVAPLPTAGAAWLPGRAGRITFAQTDGNGSPVAETGSVDIVVEPAGGTVLARLSKITASDLTGGSVMLRGNGRTIKARAEAAVLPGQDASTGANVSLAAPGGQYVMTVVPDDSTLAPPDDVLVRVVSGQVKVITETELPPLRRTLGRLTGTVVLTSGEAVAGMTVQARREGDASVTPAVTDDAGGFTLAVPAGRYEVAAVVPRGAAVLAGAPVTGLVEAQTATTLAPIRLTAATAVIERTLVKPGGVALTEDEAAAIAGTALVKDQSTGRSTSIAFTGDRVRISVAPGTYRIGISITAGGFLAPEAESGVIVDASTPNPATRTITPSNVKVVGSLVTGTTDSAIGAPVAIRATVRASGISGPATGVIKVAESDATGAFTFALAAGTWRIAAAPDVSQGFLANVARPYVEVTVTAIGGVTPASPAIDLSPANAVISGSAVVAINGADVPLAGVRVRADVSGTNGSFVSISAETAQDGSFSVAAPAGAVVVASSGATARYGTASGAGAADDPAFVIDPAPLPITPAGGSTGLVLRFANAAIKVTGTVSSGTRTVSGATVTATSTEGMVRTTTSLGGSKAGTYELRLSAGDWAVRATADLATDTGGRVPAISALSTTQVGSSDIPGVNLDLIAEAIELPPAATGAGEPETGALIRAGRESAQLNLAPGAVNEAVQVSVVPLGSVPTVQGFVPFGDAFQISLTSTATGQPITSLSVDSTVLITYALDSLRKFRLTSASTAATASDLRAARYDSLTGTYTPISSVTATQLSSSLGQFAISTSVMGTYVLTTSEALVRIPAKVTGVTASPSSGTLSTGSRVTISVTFDDSVTVSGSGSPRIAMGTGASGAARTPASYATYTTGSGTDTLVFTYTVVAGDTSTDLDYASIASLEANGATLKTSDGVDADLTLASPGQAGSISVTGSIIIDTSTSGGGGGSGGSGGESGNVISAPTRQVSASPVALAPAQSPVLGPVAPPEALPAVHAPVGISLDRLISAFAAIPGGLSPTGAAAISDALGAVEATTARSFVEAMSGLPPAQAAQVLSVIAVGTAEEGRATVAVVSALPPGSTIARPGGSLRAPNGAETFTYALDDGEAGVPRASLVGNVEVAGVGHAIAGRGPVVFLVRGGQAALVTRPRAGAWPDLRFPLLAGFLAGTGPSVTLPADATSLTFEPAPDGLNVVERGSLGGGIVVPLARPFAIRVESTDSTARVGFTLPSPKVGAGQVLAYLHSLRAPGGQFQGYLRAPAAFDGATGSQTWTLDARASTDLLVLVAAIQPGYIQNFDAAAHIYSGPDDLAVDFGEAGPAFTTFTVVGPQVGTRIYVYSPVSKGYGWVDAASVGPSGPPQAEEATSAEITTAEPVTPAVVETAPVLPARGRPDYVQNFSAGTRLFSSPYDDAADFGPVGAAFVTFVVVGGPENGHLHVLDSRTGGYAWIEAKDVGPSGPP